MYDVHKRHRYSTCTQSSTHSSAQWRGHGTCRLVHVLHAAVVPRVGGCAGRPRPIGRGPHGLHGGGRGAGLDWTLDRVPCGGSGVHLDELYEGGDREG